MTRIHRLVLGMVAALTVSALDPADGISQTTRIPDSAEEIEAIYLARQDSARSRFSPADVQFVSSMIHHHAQALTMAAMAPTHGASPTLRTLAARIANSQRDEIATMGRWLEERGQPVPEIGDPGAAGEPHPMERKDDGGSTSAVMHDPQRTDGALQGEHAESHSHAGSVAEEPSPMTQGTASADHLHSEMPGMLSDAQMAALDAARGAEFDRLFLAMMIFHHRGAVAMVEDLFASDDALQDTALFKLASDIFAEQTTEIDRMSRMLVETTGSPLGPALIDIR